LRCFNKISYTDFGHLDIKSFNVFYAKKNF
jgi:hypothetical protein